MSKAWEVAWTDYVNCLRTLDEAHADIEFDTRAPFGWPSMRQRAKQAAYELAEAEQRLRTLSGD